MTPMNGIKTGRYFKHETAPSPPGPFPTTGTGQKSLYLALRYMLYPDAFSEVCHPAGRRFPRFCRKPPSGSQFRF